MHEAALGDDLLKKLVDSLSSANARLVIQGIDLRRNKLTDKYFDYMFSRTIFDFSQLTVLSLSGNYIKMNVCPSLVSSVFNCLTWLSLSDNPLGVVGIQSLETAVQAGVLVSLDWLALSNTLTDDADINGSLLTVFLPSIASHCPHLRNLLISRNILSIPGAYALGEALPLLCKGKWLIRHLDSTNFNGEAVCIFLNAVKKERPSLYLGNNPFGVDGLLALFMLLGSDACCVEEMNLKNTIHPYAMKSELFTGLSTVTGIHSLSKLRTTDLSNNNFSEDRIFVLAECI